ncbi:serine dehydratase [Sarcoptes scabiei]|nr:serine dehydratase [Sarcoptes scabiei]
MSPIDNHNRLIMNLFLMIIIVLTFDSFSLIWIKSESRSVSMNPFQANTKSINLVDDNDDENSSEKTTVTTSTLAHLTQSNADYFRHLLTKGIGFNKTILFHHDEVTSEIVKKLRTNPNDFFLAINRTDIDLI